MIIWTDRARERLDAYLDAVRDAVDRQPDVDADEVVSDVRAHIEAELGDSAAPVSPESLERVIDALGEPDRWAGSTGSAAERPTALDLGIAAVALALAAAGLIVEPLLILPAWAVARFRMARVPARGAERWLLYPPLILGDVIAIVVALCWPYGASVAFGAPGGFAEQFPGLMALLPPQSTPSYWLRILTFATIVAGAWWILIGAITTRRSSFLRWLLYPFAPLSPKRLGRRLMAAGAVIAVAASLTLL